MWRWVLLATVIVWLGVQLQPPAQCLPDALEKISTGCNVSNGVLCVREGCFPGASVLRLGPRATEIVYRIGWNSYVYNLTTPYSIYCASEFLTSS